MTRGHPTPDETTGGAVQTWQRVGVLDSLHDGMFWFPSKEWMEMKVFWGCQYQ